ncbi:CAF17-like 4Fe-4S cluster assembly/insertion protein YgfZ [Massilia psychrophila]|uniref:Folate-binding protein YgfZ n=1 Tax=Massilia psychrophila TaxID=1603353 RepID=A0A2G8T2J5_9BURK|nr:folate-binding protein YgfZ [Massilia psychrophila]PIL40266.1 folate-binding protein YgfZ [Massilia psychrophila]GGE76356.1 folate-binding protein [Massilia psychrophila]
MDNWNNYLASQGARHSPDDTSQATDFGHALSVAQLNAGFVAVISDLGLISVSGEDAASFLHNQLTNDVQNLGFDQVRLAGYCSPKGRLHATLLMWRNAESVFLQLPRELQPALQKRLSMFVMRSKAKLTDAGGVVVLGLGGLAAQAALKKHFAALPEAPYARIDTDLGTLLRVADGLNAPRYEWLATPATAQAVLPALRDVLALGGNQAWHLSSIHAGVPQVSTRTQEQFVPQMINFELLGGVNFKKGCYPGQEIVARSQYLGTLKRRTTLATIADANAQAGDEVFAEADPGQPCGMVVNGAPNGLGGTDVLVEMKLAALAAGETGNIRLGSATGAPLTFLAMPYPLDALVL